MKISVFGLGYVGCVSAACLADMGHEVIGVDVNPKKLDMVRRGESPIIEPGLDELLKKVVDAGQLRVTEDAEAAVLDSDVSLICVGTPSRMNGSLDTHYMDRVMEQIGGALAKTDRFHVVTIRSTLLPGVMNEHIIPLLENTSGKKAGADFGLCINPEFLRESTAISDFRNPPFTVIGALDERSADIMEQVYADISAPVHKVDPNAASMVKYASNSFHALKVAFANEIGAICNDLGIDSQTVMHIFQQDRQLNISTAYLRPGFAFGGSCLPKDVRALLYTAKHRDVGTPLLSSILPSNDLHIQRAVDRIIAIGQRDVALIGLSFKSGTDDLRESPMVRLAETLIGKGYRLTIYDEEVSLSNLFGRNQEYIERVLPHIHELMNNDLETVASKNPVLIVGKQPKPPEKLKKLLKPEQIVLDLTGNGKWPPAQTIKIV
ncbi:MAG: nucleotide sugar dehydrogenase [candidate division KSB1 bacterium]|nr:nucleotide sugar dehydrogenase [candidate division KSB1 bacterium]